MKKPILEALSGVKSEMPPIWLMRQAGRFLPEYRELRKNAGGFLNMCYSPELASEVTLQPIRRFEMDGAILFSDILVIPDALGQKLWFEEGEGPRLSPEITPENIDTLSLDEVDEYLKPIYGTVERVKADLEVHHPNTTLIGFAGAPWTVATYMIEGKGSKAFAKTRQAAIEESEFFGKLIDLIAKATVIYLSSQIKAGAEAIQIFDSWAGVLPEEEFHKWAIDPCVYIVDEVRKLHPETKIIGFPRGAGILAKDYIKKVNVDGLGIDYSMPVKWAADNLQHDVCIQGNLDNVLLAGNKQEMLKRAKYIKDVFAGGAHIFNLGHGVLPHTPVENVESLMDMIRS